MSETKIKVPEGMLKAAMLVTIGVSRLEAEKTLEAAMWWLAENPIVPTPEQARELWKTASAGILNEANRAAASAIEWQRRMFLAPEPEVPEAVEDLLNCEPYRMTQERIIEAYRRGQMDKA